MVQMVCLEYGSSNVPKTKTFIHTIGMIPLSLSQVLLLSFFFFFSFFLLFSWKTTFLLLATGLSLECLPRHRLTDPRPIVHFSIPSYKQNSKEKREKPTHKLSIDTQQPLKSCTFFPCAMRRVECWNRAKQQQQQLAESKKNTKLLEGDSSSDESLNNSLELNTKQQKKTTLMGEKKEKVNRLWIQCPVYSHECLWENNDKTQGNQL